MNNVRFQASRLTCLALLPLVISCGGPAKQADALVTIDGKAAGVVVQYKSAIDGSTVSEDTYKVTGREITSVFVSDSNPFTNDPGKIDEDLNNVGRYVVILLSPRATNVQADATKPPVELTVGGQPPKPDVRVRQVSPINTLSGKVIKPWENSMKTKNSFLVAK